MDPFPFPALWPSPVLQDALDHFNASSEMPLQSPCIPLLLVVHHLLFSPFFTLQTLLLLPWFQLGVQQHSSHPELIFQILALPSFSLCLISNLLSRTFALPPSRIPLVPEIPPLYMRSKGTVGDRDQEDGVNHGCHSDVFLLALICHHVLHSEF